MIQSYSFGSIKINDKNYRSDIIIYPDRIDDMWWREEGHSLSKEDIEDILAYKPDVLIIGKGYFGILKVPQEIIALTQEAGIELIIENTKEAVKRYNELVGLKKVVAALHLTC